MTKLTNNIPKLSAPQMEAHWMAFTANRAFKKDPRILVSAQGLYYTDQDGRQVMDTLSGLWCCGLGHSRAEIAQAIAEQAKVMDYSPAFQFGHPLSFEMANRLVELTPKGLDYVLFSDSGSETVDTALKTARAYWRLKGMGSKTRFIGREKGYHGVNFGGISVGGLTPNRRVFGEGISADHLAHTQLPANAFSRGLPEKGAELADELAKLIAFHDPSNVAAVIIEPMAGSGGVVVPPKGYLERIAQICKANQVLLIFDEVITGFGRTGHYSGAETFGITPDMLTCAKQITNGAVPMGATLVSGEIYNTFMEHGGAPYALEYAHGYTYSAHPLACAAGLAALALLQKEDGPGMVRNLAPYFENAVHALKGAKNITDIRNFGLAAGITFAPFVGQKGAEPLKRPYEIAMGMWKKGFYVRFGGDTITLAPPFTIQKSQIDSIINALGESINRVD